MQKILIAVKLRNSPKNFFQHTSYIMCIELLAIELCPVVGRADVARSPAVPLPRGQEVALASTPTPLQPGRCKGISWQETVLTQVYWYIDCVSELYIVCEPAPTGIILNPALIPRFLFSRPPARTSFDADAISIAESCYNTDYLC